MTSRTGNGEESDLQGGRVYTQGRHTCTPRGYQHKSMHCWAAYVQAANERQTDHLTQNQLLLNCVPTVHHQANVASRYGPIAAGPSNTRSHVHHRHSHVYGEEIGGGLFLNVSGSHVDGAIESGLESGRRQGCSGRAIAGIYRPGDHRDLLCRRSDAIWVKANDYPGAGAQVSAIEVENRRGACRCGHDAAPCARPFRVSLPLSPPCVPLCVVSVRPSPQPLSPRLDQHMH
jgi:hypothetical protein